MMLAAFVIFVHMGCESPPGPCATGFVGPIDNHDRKAFPLVDNDWVCVKPLPRLPYPNILGDKPLDEPGPKDMDAVAKAAIFVESCVGDGIDWPANINRRIETIYSTVAARALQQAIADRVHCFQNKANGCEAVRECLGLYAVSRETGDWLGCYDNGIAMSAFGGGEGPPYFGTWYNLWFNCKGLGLECVDISRDFCALPRPECSTVFTPYCTKNNEPRYCGPTLDNGDLWFDVPHPSCTTAGLTCRTEALTAYCAGSGPSCEWKPDDQFSADFGQGIACNDSNTLRACINGYEQIVDCSAMAKGFHCIGGSRPHCGADFQCNYDRSNPIPTCNGTVLEVCNGGVRTQIDCKSLGFDSCDPVRGVCVSELRGATH